MREHDPAITFLCSPNNPTGVVEDPAVVDAALAAGDGLVVVDEAYAQFADWSALDLVADDRPLVVVRTFSKTWSMAAARLGYLVGPTWLVARLYDVALPYHLDAAKQVAGTLALRHVDEMDERVKIVVDERERLLDGLARAAASRRSRAAPTSCCSASVAATSRPGTGSGRAWWIAACSCATARAGRAWAAACG